MSIYGRCVINKMAITPESFTSSSAEVHHIGSHKTSTLAEDVDKELTCAICLSRYEDPRLLPCLHTYCKGCLERCLEREKQLHKRDQITCPQCKEVHDLSSKRVDSFRSYHVTNNLLEYLRVHEAAQDGEKHQTICCSIGLDDNEAVARCSTCCCYLCESCWASHSKMIPTKEHKVISLDQIKHSDRSIGTKSLQRKQFCLEHEDQLLRMYCRTCKEVICQDCALVKHRSSDHDYVFVKDVHPQIVNELEQLTEDVKAKEVEFRDHCDYIKKVRSANAETLKNCQDKVNKTFDRLKEALEARRASLIAELHDIHEQEEEKLDAEASSLELTLRKITSKIGFVQQLLENGSDVEIVSVSTEAKENMEKLKEFTWKTDTTTGSLMQVTLDSQIEDHLGEHGVITNELQPEDIVISDIPDSIYCGEEVEFTVAPSVEMQRRHYPMPKPDIKVTRLEKQQSQQSRNEPCKLKYADNYWTVSCLLPNEENYTVSVNVNGVEAQMSPLTLIVKYPEDKYSRVEEIDEQSEDFAILMQGEGYTPYGCRLEEQIVAEEDPGTPDELCAYFSYPKPPPVSPVSHQQIRIQAHTKVTSTVEPTFVPPSNRKPRVKKKGRRL